MSIKRILGIGLVVWVVTNIISWLTCGWLFRGIYEIEPVLWKSPEEIMSAESTLASLVGTLVAAVLLVLVYAFVNRGISGNGVQKGVKYAFFVWLVGPLPGIAMMPIYMPIAIEVVLYWLVQSLIVGLISGAIIGKMYKDGMSTSSEQSVV